MPCRYRVVPQHFDTDGIRCHLTAELWNGLLQPHGNIVGLAVDVNAGLIFWANNARGTIYRANMDGSEIESIVSEGTNHGLACWLLVNPVSHFKSDKSVWVVSIAVQRQGLDTIGSLRGLKL